MARVVISRVEKLPLADFPAISGIVSHGRIDTRAVIAQPGRPVLLWKHEIAPGAELRFDRPSADHGFYVLSGSIDANGKEAVKDGFVAAEHMARGVLRAGGEGAVLLHFHRPDGHPQKLTRPGGNIHVVDKNGILKANFTEFENKGTLWADADCPTCEIWLHKTEFAGARSQKGTLHSHSSDEIIFILEGEMLVGNRTLTADTALAVDANTRYGFGVGEPGVVFLNFRPHDSTYVGAEGTHTTPVNEREQWRSAVSF